MKKQPRAEMIYIRYILPVAVLIAVMVISFIPSYRYVVDGSLGDSVSAFDLIKNSIDASRNMLFGTEEASELALMSSRIFLVLLAVGFIGMLISFAASVYSLVMTMRYFFGNDEAAIERQRALFVTFFPNRIVLCALEQLVFLLVAFPYALPLVYKGVFGQNVTMALVSVDPLSVATVGFIAVIVLSCICAPMERKLDADVFKKRKDFEPDLNDADSEDEEKYEEEKITLSKEQNEFIRNLLRERKETTDTEITEEDKDGDE